MPKELIFTRAAALAEGLSVDQVRHRLRAGSWVEPFPRVYAHSATPLTPAILREGALLWAGPGAALSHRSAAALWQLDGITEVVPEITLTSQRRLRNGAASVYRRANLTRADVTHRDGLRCTNPVRTIIDLAGMVPANDLETALESARRRRFVTIDALRARNDALGGRGRRGATQLAQLLHQLDGRSAAESVLEVKVARKLRRSSLPKPTQQYQVGRYRLDFAWPEARVALECDGRAYHQDFDADRARWSHLAACGWRIVFVTWSEATREPRRLINNVAAALAGL
jgi:very-short-patch-repair endonuclease